MADVLVGYAFVETRSLLGKSVRRKCVIKEFPGSDSALSSFALPQMCWEWGVCEYSSRRIAKLCDGAVCVGHADVVCHE